MENQEFKHNYKIQVRYSDYDHMQMVNNAVYLSYLEFARMHYLTQACQWNWQETGIVVANVQIDFRVPIRFFEQPHVFIKCTKIGTKSFDLLYLIAENNNGIPGKIFAQASTVMVVIDMKTMKPASIPEVYKNALS
jgi:acyl-CoA thioester hydrolase